MFELVELDELESVVLRRVAVVWCADDELEGDEEEDSDRDVEIDCGDT